MSADEGDENVTCADPIALKDIVSVAGATLLFEKADVNTEDIVGIEEEAEDTSDEDESLTDNIDPALDFEGVGVNEKGDALLENDGDTKYGSAVGLVGDDLDAERSKWIDSSKFDIDIDVWGFAERTADKLPALVVTVEVVVIELEEGVSSVWFNSSSLHKNQIKLLVWLEKTNHTWYISDFKTFPRIF